MRRAPLVVSPLVEPAGHKLLQADEVGSQGEAPGSRVVWVSHPECQPVLEVVGPFAGDV